MLELNKMNAEMLTMVCGGDYGDEDKDTNSSQSWYQVGQEVELYNTAFHYTTTRHKIQDKKFEGGHWNYKFIVHETSWSGNACVSYDAEKWYSASAIER